MNVLTILAPHAQAAHECPSRTLGLVAFALGVACALATGYLVALMQLTGRRLSYVARKGFWNAMRAQRLDEYVEKAAQEEREIYALHVLLAIKEIGGSQYHVPMTREGLRGIYKLAEMRMLMDKKNGKDSPVTGAW